MRLPAVVAVLVVAGAACRMDPRSPAGFRLPAGDPERGRTAFLELKCNTCHKVAGTDLPAPAVDPPVPVVLGGEVPHARTDGDLVTAIINPSHRLAPGYPQALIRKGDRSRMPEYAQVMTVQQMIDVVAFLQSRYAVVRPGR